MVARDRDDDELKGIDVQQWPGHVASGSGSSYSSRSRSQKETRKTLSTNLNSLAQVQPNSAYAKDTLPIPATRTWTTFSRFEVRFADVPRSPAYMRPVSLGQDSAYMRLKSKSESTEQTKQNSPARTSIRLSYTVVGVGIVQLGKQQIKPHASRSPAYVHRCSLKLCLPDETHWAYAVGRKTRGRRGGNDEERGREGRRGKAMMPMVKEQKQETSPDWGAGFIWQHKGGQIVSKRLFGTGTLNVTTLNPSQKSV
ncbi:hypothetical protein BDQ17DRAFT_1329431 [Cyathus striatus]|nr:hypothetical protein BDQ17DRAFT_1329431 [Cyathus striatus]